MNVSIIGATGYTGFELVKILLKHPKLKIKHLTSDSSANKNISEIYPYLKGLCDMTLINNDFEKITKETDVVFLCLPHGASMDAANFFAKNGKIVIDLSADFRISDPNTYKKAYNENHKYPELLDKFVYGIPEIFEDSIKKSTLIANPGCYPTSIIIPLYPLIKNNLLEFDILIADSKSGVSGAGKTPSEKTHFCEVNEDFKPYSIFNHRHNPEIDHILSKTGSPVHVIFTPHLLPINRGILSTIYTKSNYKLSSIIECLKDFYNNKTFVRIYEKDIPSIKNIVNTNFIDIGVYKDGEQVIIISTIDNLIKGASGQAVQNLNLLVGFKETDGLL
ncbi:MAG: N-acetyl-gamma-glutamyl-phosphate reductase [Calditerrivibrio sp.]|nr:N-acetyl-gamma-glutamyl-phosphate reductase [Calditerrivibrio sp.]